MTQVKFSARELELVRNHGLCRIATITADGWPHCVPVGYVYSIGKFYIPVSKRSKKARNLKANPRASIVIEDETERVMMIQGKVES
jgi:nitroimidazol reductase NimA-like FMN-containing flavoprotein (pyridoxamine 5'-phosphate oxidase superfamily)